MPSPPLTHQFAREEVLPSYFMNRQQQAIGNLAENVRITRPSNNSITVPASAGDGQVTIAIDGLWRYRETNVSRTHPGGAAGEYPIFAVCTGQNIVSTPEAFTDTTNYAFDLRIVAPGTEPTIVPGSVEFYRRIGRAVWDGAKITRVILEVDQRQEAMIDATAESIDQPAARFIAASSSQSADIWQVLSSSLLVRSGVDSVGGFFRNATAGQNVMRSFLVAGDANPAWVVHGDGSMEWGPGGGTAPGISLDRTGAGEMSWDSAVVILQKLTANADFQVNGTATLGTVNTGALTVAGGADLNVSGGDFSVTGGGHAQVGTGGLGVSGATALTGGLSVTGGSTTVTSLSATGASTLAGLTANATTLSSLNVSGASTLAGLTANATTLTSLNVSGATTLAGLTAGTGNLTALNVSGASALHATTATTVDASGAVTVGGALTHTGVNLGFFGTAVHAQMVSPTQARLNVATHVATGTSPSALSASSTLSDVIAVLSRVLNAMQPASGSGLIAGGGNWSS